MNMRAFAGRAVAAVALAGALTGVTAGVANALPSADEAYCEQLFWTFSDSYVMAGHYLQDGNTKEANWWNTQGDIAYANYTNAGC